MSHRGNVIQLPRARVLRPAGSRLRITNVKSIKPPDADALKKQEEDKLRAELQKEIVSRSRSCANKTYQCTLPVLSGRQYCVKHILKDSTAPYKQCAHTYSNGERCPQPAPIDHKEHRDQGLCFEHARLALNARQRTAAPPPPVTTTETLLNQLQHYVRPERVRTTSCASSVSVVSEHADPDYGVPSALDPFKQIDATAVNAQYSSSIMECASGTDSDCDSVTLGPGGSCRDVGVIEESEDAPCEDAPLWRAGVYTAEEAVWSAKNSLHSLQSLYVKQMGRLRTLLQMARSQYLKSLKAEKEQYCSINSQARTGPLTVRERRQLRKLKAYAGYHRRHGVDALLARKLHHKRAKAGGHHKTGPQSRCTFVEGGVRCPAGALPAAKHCQRHILLDRHQVLFIPCGDSRGCGSCQEASARLPLATLACRYHTAPPHYATFTLKKDESDSDSESHSTSDESQADFEPSSEKRDVIPPQEATYQ